MTNDREFEETLRGTMHDLFPEPKTPLLHKRIQTRITQRRRQRRLASGAAAAALVIAGAIAVPIALDDGPNTSTPGRNQSDSGSNASCGYALRFQGRVYGGARIATSDRPGKVGEIPAAHLHRLGRGTRLPCDEVVRAKPIPVMKIDGVSPKEAVVAAGRLYTFPRGHEPLTKNLTEQPWIRWVPEPDPTG